MKLEKRIYCIEGHWDYGRREIEPSVEPMLKLLATRASGATLAEIALREMKWGTGSRTNGPDAVKALFSTSLRTACPAEAE